MYFLIEPKLARIWMEFFNRLTIEALEALLELWPNDFSEKLFGEKNPVNKTELIKNFIETHKNLNEEQVLESLNSLDKNVPHLFLIAFSREERNKFYEILLSSSDDSNVKKAMEIYINGYEPFLDLYKPRYIANVIRRQSMDETFDMDTVFDMANISNEIFHWDRINIKSIIKRELSNYDSLLEYMKIFGSHLYNPDCREDEDEDDIAKDKWLDEHELGNIQSHIKRYFSLEPPFVSVEKEIPEKVKELYAETRRCYVFGQFRASVALSRSVIEVSLKDELKVGTINQDWSAGKCLTTALKINMINQELYIIGDDINVKANKILHAGAGLSEEEALYFLNNAKTYIELLYKKSNQADSLK